MSTSTCCGVRLGPCPRLSFRIGKTTDAALVELVGNRLVVRGTKIPNAAAEGTQWVLMPLGYLLWSEELGCEIVPDTGKRFYLSTTTNDPHHFVMEW